jgi:hypothetical protein
MSHNQKKRPKRRRHSEKTLDIALLIDRIFAEEILLTVAGKPIRLTFFEAILQHVWQQSLTGNRKASRLYTRYLQFAASQDEESGFEVRFGNELLTADEVQRKHGRSAP